MAATKVTTKVLADDAVTIDKIADAVLVTESEGISSNDNDTTLPTSAAVKDYVDSEVSGLVDSAPGALDTLNELAAALGDDANFSTTVTNSIATKQDELTASTGIDITSDVISITDTAVTAGSYGDANNTPQITVDAQGRLTAVSTVTTAGSGGGGGGTLDIEQQTFNGDGSIVAFTLTSAADSENNLQVFIDGVYQSKDNFSVSGTTLTLSTAPGTGTDNIEVIHLKSVIGSVRIDTFTGDGSDATFDLANSISTENNTQIFINGVYQSKGNYSTSGTTITFTTAPPNGTAIEVVHIVPSASGGNTWESTVKTADFTAIPGEGYFVNTTSAEITVTLPSSPTAGDEVSIVDYAGTADTNNIIITSSDKINGSSNDVKINYERGGVSIVYVDSTQGWMVYNATNETATALINIIPLAVDYLVIAGGGGGGGQVGGGGGAGGLRTTYTNSSSLTGHTETALSLSTATNYSVSVGPAGAAGTVGPSATSGGIGGNSQFGTVGNEITSTGGGYGGSLPSPTAGAGGSGGGGGATTNVNGPGGAAVSSPAIQGKSGGNGFYAWAGGGGGGATTAGANGVTGSIGGIGGAGLAVNIISTTNAANASVGEVSGSDVYFAGGGGGCGSNTSAASGGIGGAGNGGYTNGGSSGAQLAPTDAAPNTGGGGGGARDTSQTGFNDVGPAGTGGSGVVILRYPNEYTISETTSGGNVLTFNTYTESTDKVTVFKSGDGTIQFTLA